MQQKVWLSSSRVKSRSNEMCDFTNFITFSNARNNSHVLLTRLFGQISSNYWSKSLRKCGLDQKKSALQGSYHGFEHGDLGSPCKKSS